MEREKKIQKTWLKGVPGAWRQVKMLGEGKKSRNKPMNWGISESSAVLEETAAKAS